MFDNFSDDDDDEDMESNVIIDIDELENRLTALCYEYNMGVVVPLPPENALNPKDFLEIFTEMFKPVDGIYEITNEQIHEYMVKLDIRHGHRVTDLLVKEGYANYGVDTDGTIVIIPTQKLIDAKSKQKKYRKKK